MLPSLSDSRRTEWLSEIEDGTMTIDGIAAREARSKRHVDMTISPVLAPSLVEVVVEGLPHGTPVAWSRQHQIMGFAH
jgi:hypothetical protein